MNPYRCAVYNVLVWYLYLDSLLSKTPDLAHLYILMTLILFLAETRFVKESGCNSIRCGGCNIIICYACGKDVTEVCGHFSSPKHR